MTGISFAGILSILRRIANTSPASCCGWVAVAVVLCVGHRIGLGQDIGGNSSDSTPAANQQQVGKGSAVSDAENQQTKVSAADAEPRESLIDVLYEFGPEMGQIRKLPNGWKRQRGVDYKTYVKIGMVRDNRGASDLETLVRWADGQLIFGWQWAKDQPSWNPHLNLLNHHLAIGWSVLANQVKKHGAELPPSPADILFNRYLRVELNGSGAQVTSPILSADASHQYRFGCRIRSDLVLDTARAEFVFGTYIVDKEELGNREVFKELEVLSTPRVGGKTAWTRFVLPLVKPPVGTTHVMARLIVAPGEDGLEDIIGSVGFDDVSIQEKPQLEITTDQPQGIYELGETVRADASISGFLPPEVTEARFELYDVNQRIVADAIMLIRRDESDQESDISADLNRTEIAWEVPGLQPGFYSMRVALDGERDLELTAQTTLVVIQQFGEHQRGLYGWTLKNGHDQMGPAELATWLSSLGVSWVKYPCWESDKLVRDELQAVFTRLQDARIQTVGMIDQPPADQLDKFSVSREIVAAEVFRDPDTWKDLLAPIMAQFTQKITTWQLGGERDFSFLGLPRFPEQIAGIAQGLEERHGQKIDVTISWPWLEPSASKEEATWQAVCRSSSPLLSATELDAFLERNDREQADDGLAGPRTWLLLDPLDSRSYDQRTRIRDLVLRMAMARKHRVQAAFVTDPHDPHSGLLRDDSRPAELLLPWRTTSLLLGNLRAVGAMRLRCQAMNEVYINASRAVVLMWSEEATEELAYFGDGARMVDVWGKVTPLRTVEVDGQLLQRVPIGPQPVFLIGCDPAVLAFRMSVELGSDRLERPLGRKEVMNIAFTNPMRESLLGQVRVIPPLSWKVTPSRQSWRLLGRQDTEVEFGVVLSNTANIGEYELEIQFALETNPPELVSVYRKVRVGPRGIDMNLETRLLPNDRLKVDLIINNNTDTSRLYSCFFFPPVGAFERRQVSVPSGQEIRKSVIFDEGAAMLGQSFRVRAVEQKSKRVMNYEVTVKR